jgi:hypothetical protein
MPLSALQSRVLRILAGLDPPWTLTGGGALVGFHLGHRTTRDLDLFWHGQYSIADARREVIGRLRAAGLDIAELRSLESFATLQVREGPDSVVVDLVADPVDCVEAAEPMELEGVQILVDTPHEVLVNKLCALLHRSELRDLVDIAALVEHGGDLDRALSDAPSKDGGFSALTLGWVLNGWDVGRVARDVGMAERAPELERFRDELVRKAAAKEQSR